MPGLYTHLCSSLLFPLHEFAKGHNTVRRLHELERSQWWSREQLCMLQLQRLKGLLLHAGTHVPYYRQLFADIGFEPKAISSLADLAQLPLLTKDVLRTQGEAFRADSAQGLKRMSTTGSSGDPMQFYVGIDRTSHDVAAKWRATRWWNVDIGDSEIVVWSSPVELTRQDRLRQLRDRLLRSHLLPSVALTPRTMDAALQSIRKVRPTMLFGYPSSLAMIAERAESCATRMDDVGIKVAFVTAERAYPYQRQQISRVFGCSVADGYGGRDAGFIAHECPSGGLHLSAEDVIVEIVDTAGNPVSVGESGEVVVTHLASGDFPFIRYRNGDIGVLESRPCTCGRGLPLIKEIQGRTNDFVVAVDGTKVHDVAFGMILRDIAGIRAFKIVQENLLHTRVLLSVNDLYHAESTRKICDAVQSRLGDGVDTTVEIVSEIPPEPSGKYRYVISHVMRASARLSPTLAQLDQ